MNIIDWIKHYLDELFPFENIHTEDQQEIYDRFGDASSEAFRIFSTNLRNNIINRKIRVLIDVDVGRILQQQGSEDLVNIGYVQQQGIKAKKNWGHRRYSSENSNLFYMMFRFSVNYF